jgi:hypothetical protein
MGAAASHVGYKGATTWQDRFSDLLSDQHLAALEAVQQKASYQTTDASLVNDMFGAALYVQSNLEANFYGAIPKVDRTGANATAEQVLPLTFRAAHTPPALQTHSEGGDIPTGRTYETEEVAGDVKRSIAVIEQSDLEQIKAEIQDGVPFDELTRVDELFQELAIDRDALAAGVSADNGGYAGRDRLTELDRVIASSDEEANATDTTDTAYTDGDLDVYDLDRSTDTWADAFVDFNAASDRQLTEDLMDDFLSGLFDFGSASREAVAILTGRDTADVLSDLQQDSTDGVAVVNFDGSDGGRDQVGDAETIHGLAGTTRFRHYKGVPIVANQTAPTDSISRIYVIPTDTISIPGGTAPRLAIEEVMEPYYEEAGRDRSQGFLSIGSFENQALYKMDHELVCRDFSACGKLRDLSA